MGQQTGSRDALVDDLGGHRRLDQRFALAAGPLATYMLLNGEHARCVIQLFADVFADALKLAAASALGVLWLVTNDGAWELRQVCLLAAYLLAAGMASLSSRRR